MSPRAALALYQLHVSLSIHIYKDSTYNELEAGARAQRSSAWSSVGSLNSQPAQELLTFTPKQQENRARW